MNKKIAIEDEFLTKVKQHIKILYDDEDANLKAVIASVVTWIHTAFKIEGEIPDIINNKTYEERSNIEVAIMHAVSDWWTNPDGRIDTDIRVTTVNSRLIERILGPYRGY